MRTTVLACLSVLSVACSEGGDDDSAHAPAMYESPSTPEVAPSPVEVAQTVPARPDHFYDERDGLIYSYIAAVSEEDRKTGKRAGDVVSFGYLGIEDGRHVLVRVRPDGSVLHRATCREPCKVISYDDGSQVGFDEGSIIGAAFADAIAGRLRVAELMQPRPPEPVYTPSPTPAPPKYGWSREEAAMISEWVRLSVDCESAAEAGADLSPCARRDMEIGPQLEARGICKGRTGEEGSGRFHRCEADSIHLN